MQAKLTLNVGGSDQSIELPVIEGTEKERALDIASLRAKTGYVALDPAFMNTASTTSAITFLDGEQGILRYRGYPIEQLAEKSSFLEVAYLLVNGELPSQAQLDGWVDEITHHTFVHKNVEQFMPGGPPPPRLRIGLRTGGWGAASSEG